MGIKNPIFVHKEDRGIVEFDSLGNWKCKLCGEVSNDNNLLEVVEADA